ncbi:MAG: NmrA/HSCARG family protein [Woeseia sp.]
MSTGRFLAVVTVLLAAAACGGGAVDGENTASSARVVLVTGATGTQGGAVVRELLSRDYKVRALTRNPNQPAAQALVALGAEVVHGDFSDSESLRHAMTGASGVFGLSTWDRGTDREVVQGRQLIDAAVASHIDHFVCTSVAGADLDSGLAHFESKYELEQYLAASGLDYTIVRPVEFMENWRLSLGELRNGNYIEPRDLSAHHQWIAASDIGFFVAEAFDHPSEWIGRTFEVAGDEMTLGELLAVFTDVLDRPVEQVQPSWDEFRAMTGDEIADMYRWMERDGYAVDVAAPRARYPDLVTVRQFLEQMVAIGGNNSGR